jgi:putative ABC transport system permease protein
MLLRDTLNLSFDSLRRNKGRSVLTMLGIIIGVASVVLMLAIGRGAEQFILSQVASFGSDVVFVRNGPGDEKQAGSPQALLMAKKTLTMRDYRRLKQQSWIVGISAEYYMELLAETSTDRLRTLIAGVTAAEFNIFALSAEQGTLLTEDDVDGKTAVAVLGHDLAQDLFGNENPIGQRVKIQKKYYRVIGVLNPAGTKFFTNMDRVIFTPVTTLLDQLGSDRLQYLAVKVGATPINEAAERIRVILRETHKLDNPAGELVKDDFGVTTQEDTARRAGIISSILEILLTSIAAISLLVGGVGIMNIMYVTVTERTREIGLRKAVGARPNDVLLQFLAEAVTLTLLAGLIGVLCGLGLAWLSSKILALYQAGWGFEIPWSAMLLGFSVSAAIGIGFGFFPARHAARLHPIEALRYE